MQHEEEIEMWEYEIKAVCCEPCLLKEDQEVRVGGVALRFDHAGQRNSACLQLESYDRAIQSVVVTGTNNMTCSLDDDDGSALWMQTEFFGGGKSSFFFKPPEPLPGLTIDIWRAAVGTHFIVEFSKGDIARIAITGIRHRRGDLRALFEWLLAKLSWNAIRFRRSELKLKVEVSPDLRIAIHRSYRSDEAQVLHPGSGPIPNTNAVHDKAGFQKAGAAMTALLLDRQYDHLWTEAGIAQDAEGNWCLFLHLVDESVSSRVPNPYHEVTVHTVSIDEQVKKAQEFLDGIADEPNQQSGGQT